MKLYNRFSEEILKKVNKVQLIGNNIINRQNILQLGLLVDQEDKQKLSQYLKYTKIKDQI